MLKLLTSLLLGIVLAAATVFACPDMIRVSDGQSVQVCTLSAQYYINGVEFCEYTCSAPTVVQAQ